METSHTLLDRLRRGSDQESWRRFDGLYRPWILRYLGRDRTIQSDADDLAQEILGVVCRELPGFERERTGSFRRWLRLITVHPLQGYYRERASRARTVAVESPLADLADDRSELAQLWDREHNEHVVAGLLTLIEREFSPTDCRAFRRQFYDGAKPVEVAAELGVAVNVVYLAKSRILARLREFGKDFLS